MNVLHHDLKAVVEFCFRILHFIDEVLCKVLIHNAIRGSKECQDVLDEVFFVITELGLPVHQILVQINFFSRPEAGFGLFVHLPNVIVLDWEEHKTA